MSLAMRIIQLAALALLGVAAVAAAPADAAAVSMSQLKACARISAAMDRLACYDALAGLATPLPAAPASTAQPTSAAASVTAQQAPPAPTPPVAAPPITEAPARAPAATLAQMQAPANAQPPPQVSAPSQSPPAAAPPARADTFGLYAAEHPTAPRGAESISATVVAFGASATGRQTLTLDGGGLWELEERDPLLAIGASVTIQRAAFGSFLLTTPNGRTHRVRRLR